MTLLTSLRRPVAAALTALALASANDVETCLAQGKASADCLAKDSVLLQVQPAKKSAVSEHSHGNPAMCQFVNPPETPYFWDASCTEGDTKGCFADNIHVECRFCGEHPYTGVKCPENAIAPKKYACDFDNEPVSAYFWDPTCTNGTLGCLADDKHIGCRFCGGDGDYASIRCPQCTFGNEPLTPYYVDEDCEMGKLGCRADGIHDKCRFCGRRPFQSIECPDSVHIPADECWFANEQDMPHYWDPDCEMGKLGCWADGIHAHCRYCGRGAYATIPCPEATTETPTTESPEETPTEKP